MNHILFVADSNEINTQNGGHFGHSNWYLVVSENGELVHSIVGDKKSQRAMIFKRAKELGFDKIVVRHMGPHAWKAAKRWNIRVFFVEQNIAILRAVELLQQGKLEEIVAEPDHGDRHHNHH